MSIYFLCLAKTISTTRGFDHIAHALYVTGYTDQKKVAIILHLQLSVIGPIATRANHSIKQSLHQAFRQTEI